MTWEEWTKIVEDGTWFRGSHLVECPVCGIVLGAHRHMLHPETGETVLLEMCAPHPGSKIMYVKP